MNTIGRPQQPTRAALVRHWLLVLLAWVGRWFVCRSPAETRRVLVLKPDHLGDVLLSTPALRMLRRQHPYAHITALVGPWSARILARNPDIDTLLTLPFPGFQRGAARHSPLYPYWLLLRFALLLRAGGFDTALLLRDDHWWGAALALLAGIPRRIGYAVPECAPFLTDALPWAPGEHVTRQALAVVQTLHSPPDPLSELPNTQDLPLHFAPPAAAVAWAEEWLTQQGIGAHERLVILHPGTGGAAKLWLPEHWAHVTHSLLSQADARHPLRLLLTGGPGEETLVQAIARLLDPAPPVLVGATSIEQLAALLGRAALVMGVDSGPLHLAVSQATPSLHLFGPGDARRFGPWGDPSRHVVLRAGLWCSPCGIFSACPRQTDPPECMQQIAPDEVIQAAQRLLSAS
jgi:heptosyltransferase-2/heptosyltransferase-3